MGARAALLLVASACVAAPVLADDAPRLFEHGAPVPLEDGLSVRTDGSAWIRRRDLERRLGIVVRELIPPLSDPFGRTRRTQESPRTLILCQHGRCAKIAAKDVERGLTGNEAFRLAAVARGLGWSLRKREGGFDLVPKDDRGQRGTKLGDRMERLVLPDLEGTPQPLDALRGTRVVLVRFASWSPSRETLETWSATWKLRANRGLEIRLLALDVEGAARVRTVVPPALRERTLVDRDGLTARLGGRLEDGRFLLLDELGIVRAIGGLPTTDNVSWIDRHLDEPVVDATRTTVEPTPEPATEASLRARLEKKPEDGNARFALARRLAADGAMEEAVAVLDERRDVANAWLHARLCLDRNDRAGAMDVLDAARRARPRDRSLRIQRWALLDPERFYVGDIDRAWLKNTLKEEDEELGRRKRRRR